MITDFLNMIDSYMYYPILIIVLTIGGIWFSIRTKFVQIRLFPEAWRVLTEKPTEEGAVSSFQALMVSTASRVGTGNIIGVSTALCLGGPGAVFWMWVLAILGSASAFIETTLAQIYKRRDEHLDGCYGGPAHYIEQALHNKALAIIFTICLIATYGFGFNLLCSYNLQSTFETYSFYNPDTTPMIIGLIVAALVALVIFGGGKSIAKITGVIVPVMGVVYVLVALFLILAHITYLPTVLKMIFTDAFDFQAIGSGIAGSCLIYGIKRGLYSNEAGVGSAPNAAASADISHPVKQGLAAVISVCIDTIFLCTATAFMCMMSGIKPTAEAAGAVYVQNSIQASLGSFGPIYITVAMALFAFTTLIGNLYYVDNGLKYLNHNTLPGKTFMIFWRILCALVVFVGAIISMDAAWAAADITMGLMALINVPSCIILGKVAYKALKDYEEKKKAGKNPVFRASEIGLDPAQLDYWQDGPSKFDGREQDHLFHTEKAK